MISMMLKKIEKNERMNERTKKEYCWIFDVVANICDFYPPASSFAWIYSVATTHKTEPNQTKQCNPVREKEQKKMLSKLKAICVPQMCMQCVHVFVY